MSIHQKKKIIRTCLLNRRASMLSSEWQRASNAITENVLSLPEINDAHVIHSYLSANEKKEADTFALIENLLETGKTIAVPVIADFNKSKLRHVKLDSLENLTVNKWGIPEPNEGPEVAAEKIDLIIVPMAGGDKHKNRIGYGKGFYDSFLRNIKKPKIGLCFDEGIKNHVPVEEHDVRMDIIVTEHRIIK